MIRSDLQIYGFGRLFRSIEALDVESIRRRSLGTKVLAALALYLGLLLHPYKLARGIERGEGRSA